MINILMNQKPGLTENLPIFTQAFEHTSINLRDLYTYLHESFQEKDEVHF